MNSLTPELVAKVAEVLKGKKLEKLMESIGILNESLAAGSWAPRGAVKVQAGFNQGFVPKYRLPYYSGPEHDEDFSLEMCLGYGSTPYNVTKGSIDRLLARGILPKKVTREHIEAWVALSDEKVLAVEELNESRPRPVITAIGLSPKVTKTLKEMSLDIDLPSIKLAEIAYRLGPRRNREGQIMVAQDGSYSLLTKNYYVKWTPGTKHAVTRFSNLNCNCEACGRRIPSGQFVPIEADDATKGHVGMWIGCDCAASIFGVKDQGLERK